MFLNADEFNALNLGGQGSEWLTTFRTVKDSWMNYGDLIAVRYNASTQAIEILLAYTERAMSTGSVALKTYTTRALTQNLNIVCFQVTRFSYAYYHSHMVSGEFVLVDQMFGRFGDLEATFIQATMR